MGLTLSLNDTQWEALIMYREGKPDNLPIQEPLRVLLERHESLMSFVKDMATAGCVGAATPCGSKFCHACRARALVASLGAP